MLIMYYYAYIFESNNNCKYLIFNKSIQVYEIIIFRLLEILKRKQKLLSFNQVCFSLYK